MREVLVSFLVQEDSEDNEPFLVALEHAWRRHLANPGESYKVVADEACHASSLRGETS